MWGKALIRRYLNFLKRHINKNKKIKIFKKMEKYENNSQKNFNLDENMVALSKTFEEGYNNINRTPYLAELFKNL